MGAVAVLQVLRSTTQDREIEVLYTGFGGSSIDLVVRFWSDNSLQGGWLKSRSTGTIATKEAYDAHGIEIPFPIRSLDIPRRALDVIQAA